MHDGLDNVLALFRDHQRFVLTTHIRPDGDALGSQLALGRFLEKLGKEVAMINSDPPPYNLGWLPNVDAVEVWDGSLAQRRSVAEADAILVMDTNALNRIGRLSGPVDASNARKVLIDHHTNPEAWFDLSYARDTASSTGELVYEIIHEHDAALIDAPLATALYTAIMTDTGSFRYNSVTPRVHRIVADVLERGDVRPASIHIAVYDTRSMPSLRLLGAALETITLRYDGRVAYVVVTQRMVRDAGASLDETEGLVNYALSIEGVEAAVIFVELESATKMSFRSKGQAYVNEWARAFGGGGHRNASGAYVRRPLDEVLPAVLDAAGRYLGYEAEDSLVEEDLSDDDAAYLTELLQSKRGARS